MTPDERRAWSTAFAQSSDGADYEHKVARALAKRFRLKTTAAKDGSFSFKGLKPSVPND